MNDIVTSRDHDVTCCHNIVHIQQHISRTLQEIPTTTGTIQKRPKYKYGAPLVKHCWC
jgi:hypothetical protein